jgi:hypothetical protein
VQFTSLYPDQAGGVDAQGNPVNAPEINVDWPGLPPGAVPDSRDITLTAATGAGGTVLWAPAADERLVIVSAYISSDTAGRVAVVEDQDVQGNRIAVQYVGANGGSSPNLVPAPWPFGTPGTPVRVVSNIAGNVYVRVSGYIAAQ